VDLVVFEMERELMEMIGLSENELVEGAGSLEEEI